MGAFAPARTGKSAQRKMADPPPRGDGAGRGREYTRPHACTHGPGERGCMPQRALCAHRCKAGWAEPAGCCSSHQRPSRSHQCCTRTMCRSQSRPSRRCRLWDRRRPIGYGARPVYEMCVSLAIDAPQQRLRCSRLFRRPFFVRTDASRGSRGGTGGAVEAAVARARRGARVARERWLIASGGARYTIVCGKCRSIIPAHRSMHTCMMLANSDHGESACSGPCPWWIAQARAEDPRTCANQRGARQPVAVVATRGGGGPTGHARAAGLPRKAVGVAVGDGARGAGRAGRRRADLPGWASSNDPESPHTHPRPFRYVSERSPLVHKWHVCLHA